MTAIACRMSIAAARAFSASSSPSSTQRLITGLSTPLSHTLSPASRPPPGLSVPVRTLSLLPRTFPKKSRAFLARQEAWRKADGVPNHIKVELVYLMPTYKKIFVRTVDLLSIPFAVVWLIAMPVIFIKRRFFPDDDDEDDDVKGKADDNFKIADDDDADATYEVDEKGMVWKVRPYKYEFSLTDRIGELSSQNGWLFYYGMAGMVAAGCLARFDMARRPLRIYFDSVTSTYHAVFSRHWRSCRVSSFNEKRILVKKRRFFIRKPDGNHLVLPVIAKRRHFRADDEHTDMFLKSRRHPIWEHNI